MLSNIKGQRVFYENIHVGIRYIVNYEVLVTKTRQTVLILTGDIIIIDGENKDVSDFESGEYVKTQERV